MTVNELRAKRARAWEACKDFLDSHRTDTGILSAEDDATYTKMVEIVDNYEKEINRMLDIEARDKVLAEPTSSPIVSNPTKLDGKTGRESDDYRKAFIDLVKGRRVSNALQEDTDSEGGYLVPTEFERRIITARDREDVIFELATRINLGAKEKEVPYVASEGNATLIAEEGAYQLNDDSFGQVVFRAYKFGRLLKASDELIADSAFDLEAYLAGSFGRSLARCQAGYFWTGTGSSQPQGVLAGAGTGVTTASTSAITADEIIDLYFALPQQYRRYATFVFGDAALKQIRKLKDGQGQYLWTPGFNGNPDTLLGRPVYTSANIPGISAGAKVGVFGDFSYYGIGDRQGATFKRLNELYAANGQVGFRGTARSDGHVLLAEALQPLKMHA